KKKKLIQKPINHLIKHPPKTPTPQTKTLHIPFQTKPQFNPKLQPPQHPLKQQPQPPTNTITTPITLNPLTPQKLPHPQPTQHITKQPLHNILQFPPHKIPQPHKHIFHPNLPTHQTQKLPPKPPINNPHTPKLIQHPLHHLIKH
ncbi:E domain-containing protein, partial [Staphylococcus aureus]|uniref:E domain-containing protein n=1 Tax=Staphylococcus aureus TaxID=1280 RepID=UPI0016434502